jgi:hypothetical protein
MSISHFFKEIGLVACFSISFILCQTCLRMFIAHKKQPTQLSRIVCLLFLFQGKFKGCFHQKEVDDKLLVPIMFCAQIFFGSFTNCLIHSFFLFLPKIDFLILLQDRQTYIQLRRKTC